MASSASLSSRMFVRLLVRAATVRRSRTLTAFFAIAIAAAVATALLNLYVDLESKLSSEFRKFGANVVVVAHQGQSLSPELITSIQKVLPQGAVAVPFAYVVANTSSGKPIVVAGTDFESARRLNGWWSVTKWPSSSGGALIGERAAASLASEADANSVTFNGRAFRFTPSGELRTGGSEDSRIYLSLPDFVTWTGVQPSTLELAIPGSSEAVN